jgi:outer membrane protein, adhesin transport system
VYEQIQNKVKAGVARRVDLEQASGRLALSDANLVTEGANLYDVSSRFQRLVGILPGKELSANVVLERDLPPTAVSALRAAISRHPGLRAAIENVRAAEARQKDNRPIIHRALIYVCVRNTMPISMAAAAVGVIIWPKW